MDYIPPMGASHVITITATDLGGSWGIDVVTPDVDPVEIAHIMRGAADEVEHGDALP